MHAVGERNDEQRRYDAVVVVWGRCDSIDPGPFPKNRQGQRSIQIDIRHRHLN
jgi:hypothetical protein